MGARLWSIRNQLSYNYVAELPAKPTHLPDKKPNIYYFVFDRYASTETLRDVYKFDNTPLLTTFAEQGFVTRQQAYANYPFTQQSISSTFAMDYLTDLSKRFKDDAGKFQTAFPYRSILSNPPIAQVLKQNGYQFNQISSWWDFTRVGSIAADHDPVKSFRLRVLGLDFWLTDLQRDIVHKSAFSPLLQKGITIGGTAIIKYDQDRNPRQNFQDQMEALEKLVHATGKNSAAEAAAKIPSPQQSPRTQNQGQPAKPQFTFAHILVPHDPYIFAADGSPAPYNGDRTDQDVDEFTKYTGQLTYVNTRIEELIKTIRTEDPDAIIAFQPDEGPYPKEFRGKLTSDHYFDPKNLNDTSMRHKFGITASYYMPGIDPATVTGELNSSVNLFPFILNHYLGYDLPYRPECNFSAGNKFVLYEYQQLTGRLHNLPDNANPDECAQHVP